MEYLIFIGIVLAIPFLYHFIGLSRGRHQNVYHYLDDEASDFFLNVMCLIGAIIILLLGIGFIYLGGCVIRYLFM